MTLILICEQVGCGRRITPSETPQFLHGKVTCTHCSSTASGFVLEDLHNLLVEKGWERRFRHDLLSWEFCQELKKLSQTYSGPIQQYIEARWSTVLEGAIHHLVWLNISEKPLIIFLQRKDRALTTQVIKSIDELKPVLVNTGYWKF